MGGTLNINRFKRHFRRIDILCGEGMPVFTDCRYSEGADYIDVIVSFFSK